MSTLSAQLHTLDIAHSPAMPLANLTTHMVPAVPARDVLSRLLTHMSDAEDVTRTPLWIGLAADLPAWRAQAELAGPLSVSAHMYARTLMLHLIAQRIEIADVVEGMDMPPTAPTDTLTREPPTPEFLSAHAELLKRMDVPARSLLGCEDLVLAQASDAHPESLLPILGFGGTDHCPMPEEHIAVLAYWQALWGARIVVCTPTRLEMTVLRKPESWRDAFELAQEHLDYCPPLLHQSAHALKTRADMLRTQHLWIFDWS